MASQHSGFLEWDNSNSDAFYSDIAGLRLSQQRFSMQFEVISKRGMKTKRRVMSDLDAGGVTRLAQGLSKQLLFSLPAFRFSPGTTLGCI